MVGGLNREARIPGDEPRQAAGWFIGLIPQKLDIGGQFPQ